MKIINQRTQKPLKYLKKPKQSMAINKVQFLDYFTSIVITTVQ